MNLPSFLVAVVLIAATSEPPPGSVILILNFHAREEVKEEILPK